KGLPAMSWQFLTTRPTEGMTGGGIWPMIRGSLLLLVGTCLIVVPFAILGGVCLAEYSKDNPLTRIVRSCVVALAGTPSIVYGLFGFAVFVLSMKMGFSLIAGWLTLALYSLPIIVLTTENALRAVPHALSEAGLALGLSKWQTIRRIALPYAMPGIMTGIVMTTGRAAGEAPPILLTAGIYYSTAELKLDLDMLTQPVANLPYHLAEGYRQGGVIPENNIWGTCLTLMLLVLLVNLTAIVVRNKARRAQELH
ncbi:MAG: phosphate ABC transporter permease PstA, partial [Armatimonadetes bacterium]|nr:phosphate ABC transporter permease PstA [Armatimonadota bacterium]